MMCARSKLDLGFAASHGRHKTTWQGKAGASISHCTSLPQDKTWTVVVIHTTHTHTSSNHLHFSSPLPEHCSLPPSRQYPSTSISHYLRRQAHQASKPSVRDPLETDTSILYLSLPDHCFPTQQTTPPTHQHRTNTNNHSHTHSARRPMLLARQPAPPRRLLIVPTDCAKPHSGVLPQET